MTHRPSLSRRAFLGGAGAMVALPFLESVFPRGVRAATGQDAPTRLLFYYVPNGIHMTDYTPTATGADWEVTPILVPMDRHRDEIHILSGLGNGAGTVYSGAPHSHATGTLLTGTPLVEYVGGQVQTGVSMDQLAAQALGYQTRFPSLELGSVSQAQQLGVCEEGFSCAYLESIAWAGPKSPLPKMNDPRAVFERLFEGFDPATTERERTARKAKRRSVLDYALDEARILRTKLSTLDRYRLDEYMDSIRELERRLDLLPATCNEPGEPGEPLNFPTHVDLMADMMVLALRCDQTRIVTYMMQNGFSSLVYDFLGIDNGHHALTHHKGDETMIEQVVMINLWEMDQFSNLLDKMRAVDDGEGTLLDHSAVVFFSGMGDGNQHLNTNLPVILAGRAGGALTPGRHTMYAIEPNADEHTANDDYRTISDLYIALLSIMGLDIETFGIDGTAPLEGLGE